MFLLITAHGGNSTCLDGIQYRRNRTHIILAQQQAEQSGKMFPIPLGFAERIVQLFQCGQKDFPKLIENLRAWMISGIVHILCQQSKTLFQMNFLKKTIDAYDLLLNIYRPQKAIPQVNQGLHGHIPRFIQHGQIFAVSFFPGKAQTFRMVFPVLGPFLAADSPYDYVVLQHIAGIRIQRRKRRAEIPQHILGIKSALGRFQSRQYGRNHTFLQNRFGAGTV